ncbi:MAG: HAMP domain-containing sensor histidine kinase [Micrococcus sp.]|nr:HAMP domain-containing sensor histidine kinase [Micrococcus sp.]
MRFRLTVLLAVVTVASLLLAGVTTYMFQRAAMYERIENSLQRTVKELNLLAADGVVPETGRPIATARELIAVAMIRTLPVRNEGLLGLEDGEPTLGASSAVELRLEADDELVAWALDHMTSDQIRADSVRTATTTYRAAIVPITGQDPSDTGGLLVAFDLDAEIADLNETFAGYIVAGLLSVIVALVAGWLILRRVFAPLEELSTTVQAVTGTDLSRRLEVTGEDDVATLGRNVNQMLDRIQAAFDSQRQLIDDVGHELRTPITIVQGNLEVMDASDPADVAESTDLSLDELQRMRRLVDDLVTLAKTARPDFVSLAAVDVEDLTLRVLEKASQLGDRRWSVGPVAHVTAMLDAQRITQAWLQLAANAVRYSGEDTAVVIGSEVRDDVVRLWVQDQGMGVHPQDQERIFERFSRGSNGARTEGSGLGLTIVSAIVAAHRGRVDLVSQVGMGSVFSMDIPLRTPAPDDADAAGDGA